MKFILFAVCFCAAVLTAQARTLVVCSSTYVKRGAEPTSYTSSSSWAQNGVAMGTTGWTSFKILMISPCGIWHAITTDGKFYQAYAPSTQDGTASNWINRAQQIGSGWNQYKFVFFAHTGDLFAITNTGEFYTSFVPLVLGDNWQGRAKKIGSSGWNQFDFVMFNPASGKLTAYKSGTMYMGDAPTSAVSADSWKASNHFATLPYDVAAKLFYNRDGNMYMVDKIGGFWRANAPYTSATKIGYSFNIYGFIFFRL